MDITSDIRLADDVFFCTTQGHGVFLDLARDTYCAVSLGLRDGEGPVHSVAEALRPFREELTEAGLLTQDLSGRVLVAPDGGPIERHLFGPHGGRAFGALRSERANARVTPIDIARFLVASRIAAGRLRSQHISHIVRAVRDRKAGATIHGATGDRLRRLVAAFRILRPWYPHDYRCLFEALALVEFLAFYRIYPTWVFAVQAQPFGAHCWVEADGVLLNETLEYAGQFTPIMRV